MASRTQFLTEHSGDKAGKQIQEKDIEESLVYYYLEKSNIYIVVMFTNEYVHHIGMKLLQKKSVIAGLC